METLIFFIIQQIASYGINKGIDLVTNNRNNFEDRLSKVIQKTIEEFKKKCKIPETLDKIPFYSSETIVEELLKFRLFSNHHYKLEEGKIQDALLNNPKIIRPTREQIQNFLQIFSDKVREDDLLKQLEIDKNYKETVFQVLDVVVETRDILQSQFREMASLLEDEYKKEIAFCEENLANLKPKTALEYLLALETRINENYKHVSSKLKSNFSFIKGICHEAVGNQSEAFSSFINAVKLDSDNLNYLAKACISYYYSEDDKYKEIKTEIEKIDEHSPVCWAIKVFTAKDKVSFLKENVPKPVLNNRYFKRLVFNNNFPRQWTDNLELATLLDVPIEIESLPQSISYDNFHHWLFVLNVTSIRYFRYNDIPLHEFIQRTESINRFYSLLKVFSITLKNSEMHDNYNSIIFTYYWLQSEIDLKNDTLVNLQHSYNNLNEDEKGAFNTMRLANAFQKHVGIDKGLDIIESYDGEMDEALFMLRLFCRLPELSKEDIVKFFEFYDVIDSLAIHNACTIIIEGTRLGLISRSELNELIENVEFKNESHKQLLALLLDSISKLKKGSVSIEEINSLKIALKDETTQNFNIALLYFENKYLDECANFLESYVDEEKETRDLYLYIQVLNAQKSKNQLKLLRLLKYWRLHFSFNPVLLRIEIELQQILRAWDEIYSISKYGLEKNEDDEVFLTAFVVSAFFSKNDSEIITILSKIDSFQFQRTENAIRVASSLVQMGHYKKGLDLLYKKAKKKDDVIARMNFLSLSIQSEKSDSNYFKDLEVVCQDSYVELEIDGNVTGLLVDENQLKQPLGKKVLSKRVGEKFILEKPMSRKLQTVVVKRITDRYAGLTLEIFKEAHSSTNNLPLETFKIDPNSPQSLEKSFIENFAGIEEQRRKTREKNFNDYYSYQCSLMELVNGNFNSSYIDCYLHLTSPNGKGFMVCPIRHLKQDISLDGKLVIDLSSGLLFYYLSKELGLKFDKLIIAKGFMNLIDKWIHETDANRSSKMSMSIKGNRVVPFFYDDNFHDRRIDFLQDIKKWFVENTNPITPEEKVDMRPIYSDDKLPPVFECVFENVLLGQREGHSLLTDDLVYTKFNMATGFISSEKYLLNRFPDKRDAILEFMLSNRYMGVTVNEEVLYSSYINQNKDKYSHVYSYALTNLTLPQNFSVFSIIKAIAFLKKLALNPAMSITNFEKEARHVLALIISKNPNPSDNVKITQLIKDNFELLGDYYIVTLRAVFDALKINDQGRNRQNS